jgi:hypothetical protein
MQTEFLEIGNGKAVARDRIPHLSFDDFRTQAMGLSKAAARSCNTLPMKKVVGSNSWLFCARTACLRPAVMPLRPTLP